MHDQNSSILKFDLWSLSYQMWRDSDPLYKNFQTTSGMLTDHMTTVLFRLKRVDTYRWKDTIKEAGK